jgi:hypothetical protein
VLSGVAGTRGLAAIAFLVAGLLPLAPAQAQSVNSDTDDNATLTRTSVVSVPRVDGRGWQLNLSLQSRYETNLVRRDPQEAGARLTPLASGGIGLPLGRQQLFVGGRFGRDMIYGVDQLPSRNRYAYGGGLGWQLGARCEGVMGAELSRNIAIFDEASATLDNALRLVTYGGEANCKLGGRLSLSGSVSHRSFANSNPLRVSFDNEGETYTLGLNYVVGPFGTVSLTGSVDERRFVGRQTLTAAGLQTDGLLNRSLQLGWSRDFGSRISVNLAGTFIDASPKPNSQLVVINGVVTSVDRNPFSGAGYNASLTFTPSDRLSLSVLASRQVRATPNVGALYIVATTAQADLLYRMSRRLSFGAGVSRFENQFRGAFVAPGESRIRVKDVIGRYYAQINYAPRQRYGLSLEASYFKRDSVPTSFSTSSFAVVMNLKVNLGRNR